MSKVQIFNGKTSIYFSGAITNGRGYNSDAIISFNSKKSSFSFGLTNWRNGGFDHQLIIKARGQNFAGEKLSAGIWYDFALDIDWTFNSKNGLGLACMKYNYIIFYL